MDAHMRFSRCLHPEIILDQRGDPFIRSVYKFSQSAVAYIEWQGYAIDWNKYPKEFITSESATSEVLMGWKFKKERPEIYHVGKDFLNAISKIDRDIPVDLLPERFFAYFSFSEKTIWDGTDWVQGMYVFIGPAHETP